MAIISRAFAFGDAATPTGFTKSDNGDLVYETEPGDSDVGLGVGGSGPEGYIYWSGPDEALPGRTHMVAYTDGTNTHLDPNNVDSKVGFWAASGDSAFIELADNISRQGLTGFSQQDFASSAAAITAMNQVPGMRAFAF